MISHKYRKNRKNNFKYRAAALNGKYYLDRQGRLYPRKRKYVYYDRKRFVKKFSFLSKMKHIWDKLYYASFVNRLVRGNFTKKSRSSLFFGEDDVHNSVNVSDFLLFNKYWCKFSDISRKEQPLWNFGNFDRDLLILKCAWDQRTTDGFFFSTKLEQARRTWVGSRLLFYFMTWFQYLIKLNFFFYVFLMIVALSMCYTFYNALLAVDFSLYTFYPWFEMYVNNLSSTDRLVAYPVPFMKFLYYLQWVSDFSFVYLGDGFWTIKGEYLSFQSSWLHFILNAFYFWFVDWPLFLDKLNAGVIFQFTSTRPTALSDFYYNFLLVMYDVLVLPHIWDILSEMTASVVSHVRVEISQYVFSIFDAIDRIDFAQNLDYYWLLFYKNVISASHWTEYFREWFVVIAHDVEAFKSQSAVVADWLKHFSLKVWLLKVSSVWSHYIKGLWSMLFVKSFGMLKSFFTFLYSTLYLGKIVEKCIYFLKMVYIYQVIEFFLFPFIVFIKLLYQFVFGLYLGSLSDGVFFKYVYQDLLHDYFYFWLEYLPYNDYIFMRRGSLSYLYSWYVFFPTFVQTFSNIWSIFAYYFPTYTFWLAQYMISYLFQFFPVLVFEDNIIMSVDLKSEWALSQIGVFYVFEQEYGILRDWFRGLKQHVYDDFAGLFYTTYIWLGLIDLEEDVIFYFLTNQLEYYVYQFFMDGDMLEYADNISADIDRSPLLFFPLQSELKMFGLLNEIVGRFVLYLFYSMNLTIRSTNFLDFNFFGNFRGFFFSGFFVNTEQYWLQTAFRNWLYWKQHFYSFSDARLSSLIKEMQMRLVNLHLFYTLFNTTFSTGLMNVERFLHHSNFYITLPDLYWEAYWNLWSSFDLKGKKIYLPEFLDYTTFFNNLNVLLNKPDRLAVPEFLDLREVMLASPFEIAQVFGLFHTYEVFREFAYTRPGNLFNFGSIVDASYDNLAEAEYDKPVKQGVFHSMYTVWGWMFHWAPFFGYDTIPLYEIFIGYYLVSSSFGEAAGFHPDMVEKYDYDLVEYAYYKGFDRMSQLEPAAIERFEFSYKEAMRSYFNLSLYPRPFIRMQTNWFVFGDLYDKHFALLSGKYNSSFLFLTFNQYWKYVWGYKYSNWIFYDYESKFFARPLLYTLFVAWRDFFVLGLPIPMILGSSYVAPFFFFDSKWSALFLEIFFRVAVYAVYFIQVFCEFFIFIITGNIESFVMFYFVFFSENAVFSQTNYNVSLFFNSFLWFYKLSLFVSNNLVFWVSAKLTSFYMFYDSAVGVFEHWKNSLKYFPTYAKYRRKVLTLKVLNHLYMRELSAFYTVFTFYIDTGQYFNKMATTSVVGANVNPYIYGYKKTSALLHKMFPHIPDFYSLEDPLVQAEVSKFLDKTVFIFDFVKDKFLEFFNWYSERALNKTYYREKYIATLPVFNILAEVAYKQKMSYIDTTTFPLLFKTYVLDHDIFLDYYNLGRVRLYEHDGLFYYSSLDDMASKKYSSSFAAYYNVGQTRRIQRIFGCWFVYDFFYVFVAFSLLFVALLATRMFWGVFFFLFDPWETYILMNYPRLAFHNMHERRDSIALRAEEDLADWLFDYCFFYHQSSDYVFLPYRQFTTSTWNRQPTWFFFENNSLDMSLDHFFDLGKPYKDKVQKEDYYRRLNQEWDQMKEVTQRLLKVKPNFYFDQSLKFFPMLDFWFVDKEALKEAYPNKPFYQILTLFAVFITVNFFVYLDFFKSHWVFNWLFIKPDYYFEYFWSTEFLKIWPTFSDYISGLFFILFIFWFWVIALFLYRVFISFIEDLCLFTSSLFGFFWILLVCLVFSTLSSARYWTGRLISSRFVHKVAGYSLLNHNTRFMLNMPISERIGVDLTDAFQDFKDDPFPISDQELFELYSRNSSLGLVPVANRSLLKASLLQDALFLSDLRGISLENALLFNDMGSYMTFVKVLAVQGSMISSGKFVPVSEVKLLMFFQKFLLVNNFTFKNLVRNSNEISIYDVLCNPSMQRMYMLNEKSFYFKSLSDFDLYQEFVRDKHRLILFDTTLETVLNNPIDSLDIKGLPGKWNLTAGLYQANWSLFLMLEDYFAEWVDAQLENNPESFLSRNDIREFLAYQKKYRPRLVTFEHVPWIVEMFQNPYSDTIVPRVSKLVWPLGGVKPTMPNSFIDLWKKPDEFLGLCDDFLAYRELLDRSTLAVGVEQAWGFVDIMNKVGSEKDEAFFRNEFYERLYQEKLTRLAFKEAWSDFDVTVTSIQTTPYASNREIRDSYGINDPVMDPLFFRKTFLSADDAHPYVSVIYNMEGYPALRTLPEQGSEFFEYKLYDADSVFDLDFGFGYNNDLE